MMNEKEMDKINQIVDKMSKKDHIQLLNIIQSDKSINITENKNGCFIDMNELTPPVIEEINKYVSFYKQKEKEIYLLEKEQETYKELLQDSKSPTQKQS